MSLSKKKQKRTKRSAINDSQHIEICQYAVQHSSTRHNDIAAFFSSKYNLNIERSTITKILSQQKKWLSSDASLIVKHRDVKFPLLEKALLYWTNQAIAGGMILSDDILQEKGRDFANYLNIEEDQINFSRGWVTGFKKRNSIRMYKLHGEADSAPLESLVNERLKLQELISKYNPEDVYNADETGLFFRMAPNQTLANQSRAGKKLVSNLIKVLTIFLKLLININ
jgi:Tc5 transposase DNA-binding domain/Fission yeast centromere protein N-terminal domain